MCLLTAKHGKNIWLRNEHHRYGGRGSPPSAQPVLQAGLRTLNSVHAPCFLHANRHRRLAGRSQIARRCTMSKKKNVVTVGKKMSKLEWEARFVIGKQRRGASVTRKDRLNCLGAIGRAMQKYGLNSIKDIKPAHVGRYFAELRGKGLSEGRIANHASAMRCLCSMMGKSEIVPSNRELGCARSDANRTKHADERVDLTKSAEVRERLTPPNRIAYDMAKQFGLRQKESLLSHKAVGRDGVDYLVVAGAKGGRPREVPITTPEQRKLLELNNAYRANNDGKLISADKSLKQGIKQLQNELGAAGATRSSGSNMHALRREWIIERCQHILNAPKSARHGMIMKLVKSVGHGRMGVISAYTKFPDPE